VMAWHESILQHSFHGVEEGSDSDKACTIMWENTEETTEQKHPADQANMFEYLNLFISVVCLIVLPYISQS
jgi:hypothetical protein